MSKWLLVPMLLMAKPVYAIDAYTKIANPEWRTDVRILSNIIVRSTMHLSKSKIEIINRAYFLTKYHFFEFSGINPSKCRKELLTVNIISESDLDNRDYFPREDEYSEPEKSLFVLGRYFRHSNNLYIVPPNLSVYYWVRNFGHELIHYFYDDCGVHFEDDHAEHREIDRFMDNRKFLLR